MSEKKGFFGFISSFILILVVAGLVCFLFVFWNNSSKERRIEVSGTATVYTAPDEALVSFGIKTREKTSQLAKQASDKILADVTALLKKFGISEDNLNVDGLEIRPYFAERDYNTIQGYTASKDISVKIKDVSKYSVFVDELLKIGIQNIYRVHFSASDIKKYRDEARVKALSVAREKAELFAKNANSEIVRVLVIRENPADGYGYARAISQSNALSKESMAAGGEEDLGSISVVASVSVSYEIK